MMRRAVNGCILHHAITCRDIMDGARYHRRSIRLKGYDYTQPGACFVTVVTQDRACLFGEIVDGRMRLNRPGRNCVRGMVQNGTIAALRGITPGRIHRHAQPYSRHHSDCGYNR